MTFLTVEDVNTVNLNHINEFYELDTSKISHQEFNRVIYDFSIISHQINGENHIFSFEIHNNLWLGSYYFTKNDGTYLEIDGSYSDNVLTLITTESSVKLVLYLSSLSNTFFLNRLSRIFTGESIFVVDKSMIGSSKYVPSLNLRTNEEYNQEIIVTDGVYDSSLQYFLFLLKKTDLIFDLSNISCTVGIVNRIFLNIDENYLPNGRLVDEDMLDIQINYNNTIIPVYYDDVMNDYYFDLDLTNKVGDKPVKLELIVNEIDLVNSNKVSVVLPCNYSSASNYEELLSNIVSGAEIIELTNDITFTSNLIIPHNLLIYANNHNLYLSSYNIRVSNGVGFEIDDANCFNGVNCFIQENNTKLILNNSKFTNAIISDNYKGSVISSEYNGDDNNIITEILGCTFINCHHTIFKEGDLKINNSKALFDNFNEYVDTDYPEFLTIFNGIVEITNSTFDIDYDTDILCNNRQDIKFAEALVGLGEDTIFNGYNLNQLMYNDVLPFFDAPFDNKSHIFVKYHYPQINTCVISSPVESKEDKSVCHMILGTDWVYKNNVKVTRSDWESENTIRKIQWE